MEVRPLMGTRQGTDFQRMLAQTMAFIQQQQFVAIEVFKGDLVFCFQWVPTRQCHHEGLFEENFHVQAIVVDGQSQQGGVQFTLLQHFEDIFGLFLCQL